jgi:phosphate transport system substrate-binding protein
MRPTTKSLLAVMTGAGACLLGACDKTPPPSPDRPGGDITTTSASRQTVRSSGSSALQPLVNAAKEQFEIQNRSISIEVSAGGSRKGLADVASGAVHIGNSDIFAPEDMKSAHLVDHKVAAVAFAAMANKGSFNATISALTIDQLAKVFTGAFKDWKEVGGTSQPIVVINRAPGSGTRTVFGNVVLGGDRFVEAATEDNSGALVAKLRQTKGAISYLAFSFQDDALLTISLKTEAGIVAPTADNVASGKWPIWSYEHMYTKGDPTGAARRFLDFVLSSDFQTRTVPSVKGFIPVTQMKVTKDRD